MWRKVIIQTSEKQPNLRTELNRRELDLTKFILSQVQSLNNRLIGCTPTCVVERSPYQTGFFVNQKDVNFLCN